MHSVATDAAAKRYAKWLRGVVCPEFAWDWSTPGARPPHTNFFIDPLLMVFVFFFTSLASVKIYNVELSGFKVFFSDGRGPCLFALTVGTWIFGYAYPHKWTRRIGVDWHSIHFVIALLRWTLNAGFFLQAYIDRPFQPTSYTTFTLAWLAGFGYPATIHLNAARLRLVESQTERRKAIESGSFKVRQCSPEDRQKEQAILRSNIAEHRYAPRNVFWYQPGPEIEQHADLHTINQTSWWAELFRRGPRQPISTRLDPELAGEAVLSHSHKSLFSRCSCCVDLVNENIALTTLDVKPLWKDQRDLYLKLPPRNHTIYGAYPAGPITTSDQNLDRISLHNLCWVCAAVCSNSELLRIKRGVLTYKQFWKYVLLAFRREALVSESFKHHDSAIQLRDSATSGCHLCYLIWASLSSEQQRSLLGEAASTSRQLSETNGQGRRVDIPTLSSLRSEVRIYLKIVLSSAQIGSLRNRSHGTKSSLYLIPHFGLNTMPCRWMRARRQEQAKLHDQDPTAEWWREHVDPIEIRATKLENQGPLYISPHASTASDGCVEFISTWLSRHRHSQTISYSDQDHIELPSPTHPRPRHELPLRLVDLTEWHNNALNIVLTADLPAANSSLKYAALSYCWRQDESYRLLRKTRVGQMPGPLSMLPTVVRDAINITRKLGISYLWVDSLCILQDDKKEQNKEISRMRVVYTNADFVLAAAAAWNGSENFLVEQNPYRLNPCLLGVRGNITGLTGNAANSFGGIYALPPSELADRPLLALQHTRFSSRGWVFQEEFLAKRIVYFCDEQVILRCNICQTCTKQADWDETPSWSSRTFPDLVKPDIVGTLFGLLWHKTINFHVSIWKKMRTIESKETPFDWAQLAFVDRTSGDQFSNASTFTSVFSALHDSPETFHKDTWWKIVEAYSERFLSKPADKLKALQGLALGAEHELKKHGLQTKKYVQGHWMGDDFTPSLLWYISNAKTLHPNADRGPSWSWAFVDGRVKNNSLSADPSPRATGVTILDNPRKGEGALHLKGYLESATWKAMPRGRSQYYVGHRQVEHEAMLRSRNVAMLDPVTADPTSGPETFLLCDLQGRDVGYFVPDAEDVIPENCSVQACDVGMGIVQCLRVVVQPASEAEKEEFSMPWASRGLVLAKIVDDEEICKRVGFFELYRAESNVKVIGRQAIRGKDPEIDVMHFFHDNHQERTITIM